MDPRLLKRPSSTRCNCWNGSAQETREWKTSRTAQVEAVARELATQQATMTQGEVRSSVSLVDSKLVTCPGGSGSGEGQNFAIFGILTFVRGFVFEVWTSIL